VPDGRLAVPVGAAAVSGPLARPTARCELSVIIPTLDEAESIAALIAGVRRHLDALRVSFELLVVDGGSRDGTPRLAADAGAVVMRQPARGYADALRAGLERARGEWVLTMDGDYSHDPDFIPSLWDRRGDADLVIASRYVPGGYALTPWRRRVLSRILNRVSRTILSIPVGDLSSGFRLQRRVVVEGVPLNGRHFEALIELLAHVYNEGWRVAEVPFHYRPRAGGDSHARLVPFALAYTRTLARLWRIRNSVRSADYDDRAFSSWIPLQRWWQRRRYATVLGMVGRAQRVLDVGCGSSKILEALPHAVGVDLARTPLRFRRRTNAHLVNADLRALPVPTASVDAVVCSAVIEHVPWDPTVFAELRRVLRPGGVLVVGTPDYGRGPWRSIAWWYTRLIPDARRGGYVERYTEATLRGRLGEAGFDVQELVRIAGAEMIAKCRPIR
jgi:dolichol-phosphate mannosyltransferase